MVSLFLLVHTEVQTTTLICHILCIDCLLLPGICLALAVFLFMFPLQMDNSPTTGGVTTTAAEKEKLAKASLASNCKK